MTDNTAKVFTTPLPKSTPPRTTNRKIGTTTFIVSSRFNEKVKGDIVSKIARLIQNDAADSAEN